MSCLGWDCAFHIVECYQLLKSLYHHMNAKTYKNEKVQNHNALWIIYLAAQYT